MRARVFAILSAVYVAAIVVVRCVYVGNHLEFEQEMFVKTIYRIKRQTRKVYVKMTHRRKRTLRVFFTPLDDMKHSPDIIAVLVHAHRIRARGAPFNVGDARRRRSATLARRPRSKSDEPRVVSKRVAA
jgi:hypothetical protein